MDNLRLTLYFEAVDGKDHAPDGPGWYLLATGENVGQPPSQVIPYVRLTNDEAIKLAKVIDKFVQGKPLNWRENKPRENISLEQAVAETNEIGKELVQRQLDNARVAVERLANLERRAKEFGIEYPNQEETYA